jgi:hypothetical protein
MRLSCFSFGGNAEVVNFQKVKDLAIEVLQENNFTINKDSIGDLNSFCPNFKNFDSE